MSEISNYLNLGQVAEAVSAVGVNEQQLQNLGFAATSVNQLKAGGMTVSDEDAKRLRQARLYKKEAVPHIRAAIAQKMFTLNLEYSRQAKAQ